MTHVLFYVLHVVIKETGVFVESMDSLERMDVKAATKETGGSKLAYSSSIPTIKPLATNTGIVLV